MESFNKQITLPNFAIENEEEKIPLFIGPYKIKSLFNKGGMSILYMANHIKTKKPIIIKVLLPKFAKNKEISNRFLEEAKIISFSNHPNIIKIFDQGKWEKGLYIAMEFVQGISLRQFIEQKSFSTKKALEIILQVAYALSHLHSHGVIHRDLKPENILITESGNIKVIDFGIARLKKDITFSFSKNTKIIGTPVYMSPEQKKNPENVSFHTDIFSLGIITYELILGKLSHGVIQLGLLPEGLKKIVENALKEDVKKRYQSIVDFITDISEFLKTFSQKPKKDEEHRDEIIKAIDSYQKNLFPTKTPNWHQLQISFFKEKGNIFYPIYLDFFKLFENLYITILTEPINVSINSLNYTTILKGMLKATIFHFLSKDLHLTYILQSLNQTLLNDKIKQKFAISILMLDPTKSKFVYSGCGYNKMFKTTKEKEHSFSFHTPNPLIGEDMHSSFVETSGNWNFKDTLILPSLDLISTKEDIENLKKQIEDNIIFPINIKPQKIIKNFSYKNNKRSKSIVFLERVF